MLKVLIIFGTRPEAIKLCPVVRELQSRPSDFAVRVCVTGQHRSMLDQVLSAFAVRPDHDLDVMRPKQTLSQITSRILACLEPLICDESPDIILVQGDTTTTFAAALAAFHEGIPVGHVEAGLRTWDIRHPFPEEMNRVLTTRLASFHFAPTQKSANNLSAEGVASERIVVTGNTGIDAVLFVRKELESGRIPSEPWPELSPTKKLIVVTAHRRESFGWGFQNICKALAKLSLREDVQIVYPVHRNPNVTDVVQRELSGLQNLFLVDPLEYVPFVDLMRRAWFLLTDSGGIQEEGPSLGRPVLVMREKTERPEAVEAGTVKLVGTDEQTIIRESIRLLEDEDEYRRMAWLHNPYGDGFASPRIADAILRYFRVAPSAAVASASPVAPLKPLV